MWQHPAMAISVEEYLAAVRTNLPEARTLLARLAEQHQDIALVVQVNRDLTRLLLWSWRSGDVDTAARILGVMEQALVDTDDDDYAPVYNSIGIGMVEDVHHSLPPDEFEAFVETWPPALREQGRLQKAPWDDEDFDAGLDSFQIPLRLRVRWAMRHPISSRLGKRGRFAG